LGGMPNAVFDPRRCGCVEPELLSLPTREGAAIAESVGRCAACGHELPSFCVAHFHLPGGPDRS
jgi:hypothetical protein